MRSVTLKQLQQQEANDAAGPDGHAATARELDSLKAEFAAARDSWKERSLTLKDGSEKERVGFQHKINRLKTKLKEARNSPAAATGDTVIAQAKPALMAGPSNVVQDLTLDISQLKQELADAQTEAKAWKAQASAHVSAPAGIVGSGGQATATASPAAMPGGGQSGGGGQATAPSGSGGSNPGGSGGQATATLPGPHLSARIVRIF